MAEITNFIDSSHKSMPKLAIITTHPIQYYSPWFALLSQKEDIEVKVFYSWSQAVQTLYDKDFQEIKWDIPLLSGYEFQFINNVSKKPDCVNYNGIDCPTLNGEIEMWGATHILVIGWNLKAHLKAMRYFKGKIPVYFRGDSTLIDEQPGARQLLRRLFLTWVYSYVDKAFYVGTNNREYFIKHGLKESQLTFAPHSIDNDRFFDDARNKYQYKAKEWKKDLGICDNDVVFLFAGKYEPRKDILTFINIFNLFYRNSIHPVKLILLGSGPLKDEVFKLIKDSSNVILLPFQNQSVMPIVYRLCDIFCLPSKSETWGLAVNESLACGTPVLVSNKVGCAVDLVNDSNGVVFESGNEVDLLNKLQFMVENKKNYTRERVASTIADYSFVKIVDSIHKELVKK